MRYRLCTIEKFKRTAWIGYATREFAFKLEAVFSLPNWTRSRTESDQRPFLLVSFQYTRFALSFITPVGFMVSDHLYITIRARVYLVVLGAMASLEYGIVCYGQHKLFPKNFYNVFRVKNACCPYSVTGTTGNCALKTISRTKWLHLSASSPW